MGNRVQVILDHAEREAFRAQAEREGLSLSAWLREAGRSCLAGRQRPVIDDAASLRTFFAGLADRDAGEPEPSWDEHAAVIDTSRRSGQPPA